MSSSENITNAAVTEVKPLNELVQSVLEINSGAKEYEGNSDCPAVQVSAENLVKLMTELKSNQKFKFEMLMSHTAVDRIERGVFELVYYLFSLSNQRHLMVSVLIPRDNPVVLSVCGIWKTAEWQEREVYDLFGIGYENHPDLRRVFLEDEWEGFPLRKDYKDAFMLRKETKEG